MSRLASLLLSCLVFCVGSAHASVPMVPGDSYWTRSAAPSERYSAMQAACQGYVPALQAQFANQPSFTFGLTACNATSSTTGSAVVTRYVNGAAYDTFSDRNYYVASQMQCPANSAADGAGACQCSTGYSELNGSCIDAKQAQCASIKGTSAGDWWHDTGDALGLPAQSTFYLCNKYSSAGGGRCVVKVEPSECTQAQGGWWRCTGGGVFTGDLAPDNGKCSPSTQGAGDGTTKTNPMPSSLPVPGTDPPQAPPKPDPNTAAPAPCPPGTFPGQVNGRDMCAPSSASNSGVKWSSSPGSGVTSSTDASGKTTTNSTTGNTVCSGGQCTTTNTTTTTATDRSGSIILPGSCPPGSVVNGKPGCQQKNSSTQSQSDFCKANPTSTQCGGNGAQVGGQTGGACQQNPSAAGCGGTPGGTNAGDLYTAKGRTMQQVLGDAKNNLQQSPLGGAVGNFFSVAGGGRPPVSSGSISIFGRTVALNFDIWSTSFATNVLAIVKTVLMVVAAFMAFRIAVDN